LEVDCTSCALVTYISARMAASLCPEHTVLLRRLPGWVAQAWSCVEHTNVPRNEIHFYHPDGSFTFSRAEQNAGDVHTFRPAAGGGPHFELVVRYSQEDAHPLADQYRPGVCLLNIGNGEMRTAQLSWGAQESMVPSTVPLSGPIEGVSLGLWRVKSACDDDVPDNDTI
jgi:hypothetical protein